MSKSSAHPTPGDSSEPVRPTLSDMRNFLEQMQEYGHGLDEWHLTREAMERVLKLAIKAEEAAIVMRLSDLSKRCAPSETPRSDAEIQLQAWHRVFETTQLSHAHARLQAAEEKAARSARGTSVAMVDALNQWRDKWVEELPERALVDFDRIVP